MPKLNGSAVAWIIGYLLVWSGATYIVGQAPGGDWSEPATIMVIFGIILPALGWFFTRKAAPPQIPVKNPPLETAAIIGYLALYAVVFLGWGMTTVRAGFPEGPPQELAVGGMKVLVHVILPALLLAVLGARVAPLFRLGVKDRGFWPALIVIGALLLALLCVVSPSLKQISGLNAGPETFAWAVPGALLWLIITVGLCEEFLFRAVLQSRLTAFLKSGTGAIVVGSILFALAHFPGLQYRADADTMGHFDDPLLTAAYTIAVLSPAGFFFGVLWSRTRSLALVVLLHVCVDILPNLSEFVQTWRPVFGG